HLVVVGGSGERDDQKRALVARADALGCADRVRFVPRQAHDAMPLWFSAADVFAFASWREGFPNVVREALACGTPCVATALPGVPEAIGADGGIAVPPGDVAAFATALRQALGRRWDRSAIRRRAAAWRWDRNAEETFAVLARVAGHAARESA